MIKAVLFDIDGVLADSIDANTKFFEDLFTQFGYQPPVKEELQKYFHSSMWDVIAMVTRLTDENEIKKIWEAGKKLSYPAHLVRIPENAHAVVEELSLSVSLGIITNRTTSGVDNFFRVFGSRELFSCIVAYEDTVAHKPDPEPLLLAVQRLGIQPSEAVYIGDSVSDMQASRAAGLKALAYSKKPIPNTDRFVTSFHELPDALKTL